MGRTLPVSMQLYPGQYSVDLLDSLSESEFVGYREGFLVDGIYPGIAPLDLGGYSRFYYEVVDGLVVGGNRVFWSVTHNEYISRNSRTRLDYRYWPIKISRAPYNYKGVLQDENLQLLHFFQPLLL